MVARVVADQHELMGFFSARRAEDQQTFVQDDPSVMRVIRSRFVRVFPGLPPSASANFLSYARRQYGKGKGKERETEATPSHTPYTSSSLAASTTSLAAKTGDKRSIAGSIRGLRKSTSTTRNWPGSSAPAPSHRNGNASDMSSRTSTDLVTSVSSLSCPISLFTYAFQSNPCSTTQ